jgi:hypothetical protein
MRYEVLEREGEYSNGGFFSSSSSSSTSSVFVTNPNSEQIK